jgi:Lrp/AsnC family transcriptional regulator, leucine-responsive regulatory protein
MSEFMIDFDDIDARIVDALQRNGRVAQVEISREVGLAPSAVLERMRKLEARGVIRGYTALVSPKAVGLGMLAFVAVRTKEAPEEEDAVAAALGQVPEVLEVHHVAGDDCFLVKIRARDAEHLGELLKGRIGRIGGVRSTRTTIVLGTLKETQQLPMPAAAGQTGS